MAARCVCAAVAVLWCLATVAANESLFIVIQDCALWKLENDNELTAAVLAKYFQSDTVDPLIRASSATADIHRFGNCRFTFKASFSEPSSTQKRSAEISAEEKLRLLKDAVHQKLESLRSEKESAATTTASHRAADSSAPAGPIDVQISLDDLVAHAMGVLLSEATSGAAKKRAARSEDITEISNQVLEMEAASGIPPWHLDRITFPGTDSQFTLPAQYMASSGPNYTLTKPVDVYIVDTGIRDSHVEFIDSWSNNTRVQRLYNGYPSLSWDCNFHGTHVAALAAGNTVSRVETSAALNHTIYDVRVLDCTGSGPYSRVINGLYAILDKCAPYNRTRGTVVNMSLGGGYSLSVLSMIHAVSRDLQFYCDAGVIGAAGNDAENACLSIPGALQGNLLGNFTIVAAINNANQFAGDYSNFGQCVTFLQPGSDIVSAIHTCDTCYGIASGTSMATPILVSQMIRHKAAEFPNWYAAAAAVSALSNGDGELLAGAVTPELEAHTQTLLFDDLVQYHMLVTADTRSIPGTPAGTPVVLPWLRQDAPLTASLSYAQKPPSQGDFSQIVIIGQPPITRGSNSNTATSVKTPGPASWVLSVVCIIGVAFVARGYRLALN